MALNIDSSRLGVPTELADAGNTVRRIAAALAEELNALRTKLAPLEGEWKGEASVHFEALKLEWERAAHALWGDAGAPMPGPGQAPPTGADRPGPDMGLLPFIAHALDVLYQNYANAEDASARTWQMR